MWNKGQKTAKRGDNTSKNQSVLLFDAAKEHYCSDSKRTTTTFDFDGHLDQKTRLLVFEQPRDMHCKFKKTR